MQCLKLVTLLVLVAGCWGLSSPGRHIVLLPGDAARQGFDATGFCRRVEMALPDAPLGTLLALPAAGETNRGSAPEGREEEEEDILDNGAKIVNLVDLGLVPDLEFFERYLGNHPVRWLQPVHTGRPPRAARPQSGLSRLCSAVNRIPGLGAFCKRLVALAANNPLAPLLAVFNPGRAQNQDVLAAILFPEWKSSGSSNQGAVCRMLLATLTQSPPRALDSTSGELAVARPSQTYLGIVRQPSAHGFRNFFLPGAVFGGVKVCADLECLP